MSLRRGVLVDLAVATAICAGIRAGDAATIGLYARNIWRWDRRRSATWDPMRERDAAAPEIEIVFIEGGGAP